MTRGLLESSWSLADRICWEQRLLPNFSVAGLRPLSIAAYRKTYRRWLGYLRSSGLRDYESPLSPVVPDLGRAFIDEVRLRTSAQSAFTEARHFKRLIKTVEPGATITWLETAIAQFARELKGPKRSIKPPSSDRLLREGRRMIRNGRIVFDARNSTKRTAARGRNLVRDGLMLALLAMRPLRLTNFAELRLGEDLLFSGNQAWIRIMGAETKTGATFDLPFPRQLLAELHYYLRGPRLAFPNAELSASLWLSDRGTPMSDQVAARIIHDRTLELFGAPISPHQFRHAAVTFLAERHPELITLAPDILGHANVFIAERFYNLASPRTGASTLQASLISRARGSRTNAHKAV